MEMAPVRADADTGKPLALKNLPADFLQRKIL